MKTKTEVPFRYNKADSCLREVNGNKFYYTIETNWSDKELFEGVDFMLQDISYATSDKTYRQTLAAFIPNKI